MQAKIKKLNKLFPNINAVCSSEWEMRDTKGIWFRQEGERYTDDVPYFNYWSTVHVHPKLQAILTKMDLYAEPNDPGTWFAWSAR